MAPSYIKIFSEPFLEEQDKYLILKKRCVFVKHYLSPPPSHMPYMVAVFKGYDQLTYVFDI